MSNLLKNIGLVSSTVILTSVLIGLDNSSAFGQTKYPSVAIEQARAKFKAELRSLQNSNMAQYISDRRSPAEKQARNNFVDAWQKVDPDVAPFLGQWRGQEISWNIHPSSTKRRVCIMMGIFGAMYVETGKVIDGNIYTETGGVIFKEGDYLGIAAPLNNSFFSGKSEFPFRHPTVPEEPFIYEDIEDRNKAEQVVQEYKNAGCTASLPKNNHASQTNIESLADGVHSYGEVPYPDRPGGSYVVFRKSGKTVTGTFYTLNTDDTYCFQGTAKSDRIINATFVTSPVDPTSSDDYITSNQSFDIAEYYPIKKRGKYDLSSLEYCTNKINQVTSTR